MKLELNLDEAVVLDMSMDRLIQSLDVSQATLQVMLSRSSSKEETDALNKQLEDCKVAMATAQSLEKKLNLILDKLAPIDKDQEIDPPNWNETG